MNECKKVVRGFILTVIWTLFFTVTLYGLLTAGERTRYISTGEEAQTVKFDIKEKIAAELNQRQIIFSFYQ